MARYDNKQLWAARAIPVVLGGLAAVLLCHNLDAGSLLNSDDPIYAGIARDAYRSGEFLDFSYQGSLVFEKPPLFFWMLSASYSLLGVNDLAARFPDAVCSFGLLALLFVLVRGKREGLRFGGLLGGTATVLFLLASGQFYFNSRRVMTDLPFWLFVFLFLLLFARDKTVRGRILAGLALGLAVMVKGPAVAVPVAAAFLYFVFSGDIRRWRVGDWLAFVLPALLVAGWWHGYQIAVHGTDFLGTYLGYHAVARITSSLVTETGPLFYLERLFDLEGPLLGGIVLLGLILAPLRAVRSRDPAELVLTIFLALYIPLIVLMKTRLEHYLLPVVIVAIVFLGRTVAAFGERLRDGWPQAVGAAVVSILAVAIFLGNNSFHLASSDYSHSTRELATAAGKVDRPLVTFNVYAPAAGWYADRKVQTWSTDERLCGHLESIDMLRRSGFVWCADGAEVVRGLSTSRPVVLCRRASYPELEGYVRQGEMGVARRREVGNLVALFPDGGN